ncbi:MAG: RHS repeat-associated core domain-containing protein, partial [Candidatus Angelobacter sp.]
MPDPASVLHGEGGYVNLDDDGHWWVRAGRVFYSPRLNDSATQELAHAQRHFFMANRFLDPFGNVSTVRHDAHDLVPVELRDPVGNTVDSLIDYRVLSPYLMTDANGNRSEIAFDTLGLVVGTALMGKKEEKEGDSLEGFVADLSERNILSQLQHPLRDPWKVLQRATTRLVYDLSAFERTRTHSQPQPAVVHILARETHTADLAPEEKTKIQHSFSYSDGFGREIQKKLQAEPGLLVEHGPGVNPRWVGSGWTIFNNKGKPIRQYEPFFSATQEFEFANIAGVSPVLFYDPIERVVATLHPNHTYDKVVFDPWRQETWDVNDTVSQTNPADDPVAGDFFLPLPKALYLPTWYEQRQSGALGAEEKLAAIKAAVHAMTPAIAFFDTLGRSFLTVAHNRFLRDGAPIEELFATRVELDIQANQRSVTDALLRTVMIYDYDMLNKRIRQASMEAGERWTMDDADGKAIRAWDSRGHNFRTASDALRRPTQRFVHGTDADNSDPRTLAGEVVYERTVYGEGQPNDRALNLRTRVFQHQDIAGVITNMGQNSVAGRDEAFDFKGNLLRSRRQFIQDYTSLPNWSTNSPVMMPEAFADSTQYDALNRPIAITTPDGSVTLPSYNQADLLDAVQVKLRGARTGTSFVVNIDYNAKGQRTLIENGNHTTTEYTYDPITFRLVRLSTTRLGFPTNQQVVQDLSYVYDPMGNVTHIQDNADIQNVVFFRNLRVEPGADYTYDAVYRLIQASGREHLGRNGNGQRLPPTATSYNDAPRVGLLQPGDGNAMGTYTEQYHYDAVGNFVRFVHRGSDPVNPGWTRSYDYTQASLLEPGNASNRLTRTSLSGNQPLNENYSYDRHGNMVHMPQLQVMRWDFKDQLTMTRRQAVNASDHEGDQHLGQRMFYQYGASGQRVRKVTESGSGTRIKERLYLGSFEIYREYDAVGTVTLQRETLHVMDDKKRTALVETTTVDDKAHARSLPRARTRYQFDNHLGSACVELDSTAALISYEEYYPYGSTSYQAGRAVVELNPKRYRYTGKERDEETGFYYHWARYYAPWLGRWTSCDPAGLVDGVALYSYGKANPVVFLDPTGTTVTVSGSTVHAASNNVDFNTSQGAANEAFLRDIRSGLTNSEAGLFRINQQNQLEFAGNTQNLSQFSELTQMLVGQINSSVNIKVMPALLASLSKNPQQRALQIQAVSADTFSVREGGQTVGGLVLKTSPMMAFGGVTGSTASSGSSEIDVVYISGPTATAKLPAGVRAGTKLPAVAGMPSGISTAQQPFFQQGGITQTLVHELGAHVEGTLRGEPNADSQFSRQVPLPGGGSAQLRDFRNQTGSDPDPASVLPNTSKTPFERSLRLERLALGNFNAKLPRGFTLGGSPNRRQADVDLVDRAERNVLRNEWPQLFTP